MRVAVADLNPAMNEASDRGLIGGTRRWGSLRQDDEEGKQPFAPTEGCCRGKWLFAPSVYRFNEHNSM